MVSLASGFFGSNGSVKKSANSDEQPSDYPLGAWSNGTFSFHSPTAEERWRRDAVDSGVHYQAWDQGRKLNEKRRQLVEMGFTPSADIYRGPDGDYYHHMAPAAREDPQVSAMRRAALSNDKRSGDIGELAKRANTRIAPEALAHMAQQAPIQAANPSIVPFRATALPVNENAPAANDNEKTIPAIWTGPPPRNTAERAALGRSGHITPEEMQATGDDAALLMSGLTAGYADNAITAIKAVGSAVTGGDYASTYDANLAARQAETEAARKRRGVGGVLTEALPTFIPFYGDAVGLTSDLKMYRDDPASRSLGNYLLTAASLVPGIPPVESALRKGERALEAGADVAKAVLKEGEQAAEFGKTEARVAGQATEHVEDWSKVLSEAQSKVYSERDARRLGGEHQGLIYVTEGKLKNEGAQAFQEGTRNVIYDYQAFAAINDRFKPILGLI